MQRREWIAIVSGLCVFALFARNPETCTSAWMNYGIEMRTCPDGKLRQTARMDVRNVRRGAKATVSLVANANFTLSEMDAVQSLPVTRFDKIELSLVDAKGVAKPIKVDAWKPTATSVAGKFDVPDVPDGDYKLHASFATRMGAGELDVAVPLYTPARIHVITDRPLYEPGNRVQFRAVVLRARDLAPLDGRPGTWIVKDPNGEVLLEEKAPAGDWGVVSGSFPLDRAAQTGSWRVAWRSAGATDEVAFTVQPFKLPRFRVDATADKAFYQAGDKPVVRGAVLYSSGAPVANAKLDIQWGFDGAWPPPLEWEEKLLPKQAKTGANGRFELALPQIPSDLQGTLSMIAQIGAVDPAGDRVEGAARVLLSQDGIAVSSVTELENGLVEGFNNRLFVRVTTPDGRAVASQKINVKRAWQPNDPGIDTELDEDGVASLQIDPGAPVNIVIPAVPFRATPRPALVTRGEPEELIAGEGAPLADQEEMDRWLAALTPCAKWVDNGGSDDGSMGGDTYGTRIGMRVDTAGNIVTAGSGPSPLEQCALGVIRQRRLPPGSDRMYSVGFSFGDPDLPRLGATVESVLDVPEGLVEEVQTRARGTRDCLPNRGEGELPRQLTWAVRGGSRDVQLGAWIRDPNGGEAATAMGCVSARFGGTIKLKDPAPADSLGLIRFTLQLPARLEQEKPQPTTMLGYELVVSTQIGNKPASTKLRVSPGQIPNLRMRVKPVLATAGEPVEAELIRGPEFVGELPKEIHIECLRSHGKAPLDADHKASLTIEKGTEGWCEITGGGVRSLVYVQPQGDLAVSVKANERYKPGDKAELHVQTTLGGKGSKAAVGLFGVDESLGQLVTLPGAGDMGRVRPQVGTSSPAFGVLDGQALTLGAIRGVNAAAATVLRVSSIPSAPELDAEVSSSGQSRFDPVEELTDHFYIVLAELHVQARAWEAQAPAKDKMRPATMAKLWSKALDACEKRGQPISDAYGRKLRLSKLPLDLLSLTDPRVVIVTGTRLPEDVENWAAWVAKEKP